MSPSKFTIVDEKPLTVAKLLQHVSSLTNESLQSVPKKGMVIPKSVGPLVHSLQSDPSPSLQTEPDMSTARHRLKPCSISSIEHVGFDVRISNDLKAESKTY